MSGRNTSRRDRVIADLEADAKRLDAGCRRLWGVSATMFRTAKYIFYVTTLGVTLYLVEYAGVEPIIAMSFAALLITGPEGLEAWLIRVGRLDASQPQRSDDSEPSTDADSE